MWLKRKWENRDTYAAATARWSQQNHEEDADPRCSCGADGQVRHAYRAVGGDYVWWTCWEHRWGNGSGSSSCTFTGPGLPAEGVKSEDYQRWSPLTLDPRDRRTWRHGEGHTLTPYPVDYVPPGYTSPGGDG